jgi:hypothetical protein
MIANGLARQQGYRREGEQGAQGEPEFVRPSGGSTTTPGKHQRCHEQKRN